MRVLCAVLGCVFLACASSAPAPQPPPAPRPARAEVPFPPTGPVELRPGGGGAEGTPYQLVVEFEGRTEVIEEGPAAHTEGNTVDEKTSLEVDYQDVPVRTPDAQSVASTLVLEALQRRTRMAPPNVEHLIEIGDDRLRVTKDDKVDTDLRGAQPKQNLTPRTLLGKPFALVVDDGHGNPRSVSMRGLPAAKKLLGTLPLRESLGWVQMPYPDRPVSPGDAWHGRRYLPNAIGKLGLGIDLELRLIGFERNGDAPCAHAVVRASADGKNVRSDVGFSFDEARYRVTGDAWFDLATGEVVEVRLQDVAEASHHREASAVPGRVHMRYEGRAALKRLDAFPPPERWADGSKRFGAVK